MDSDTESCDANAVQSNSTTIQEILNSRIPYATCHYDIIDDMPSGLYRALIYHDHIPFKGCEEYEYIRNKYSRERLWVLYATRYILSPRQLLTIGKMYPKIRKLITWVTRCYRVNMLRSPPESNYSINTYRDTDNESSWEYEARMDRERKQMAIRIAEDEKRRRCKIQDYTRFISIEDLKYMNQLSAMRIPNYEFSWGFLREIVSHPVRRWTALLTYVEHEAHYSHHIIKLEYSDGRYHTYTIM